MLLFLSWPLKLLILLIQEIILYFCKIWLVCLCWYGNRATLFLGQLEEFFILPYTDWGHALSGFYLVEVYWLMEIGLSASVVVILRLGFKLSIFFTYGIQKFCIHFAVIARSRLDLS